MVERTGLRARGRKNSKILECAARWFCESEYVKEFGEWHKVQTIFNSMTFKNGNLYKNHRFQRSMWTLASHMRHHKAFKHRKIKGGGTEYTFDKSKYDEYFGIDPIVRPIYEPDTKIYTSPKSVNGKKKWGDGTRWIK